MTAFYNEIEPYAAQWLRNLIDAGHIAPGVVDERDIRDIGPDELAGFTQCHFFAGIGVWSHALRTAGWPDDRPVWTGSCPCQPFSAAGKGGGFDDERHLWPGWFHLIEQRRPVTVFGEQVASKDGYSWLDLVQDDMEGLEYAIGALVCPAAGVGAPHIRHRTFFVANTKCGTAERYGHTLGGAAGRVQGPTREQRFRPDVGDGRVIGFVADTAVRGRQQLPHARPASLLGEAAGAPEQVQQFGPNGPAWLRPSPTDGFWRDADWLCCRDGKWRPVEPSTFPLAHGAPARMGRLRAYGNAIVPQVASEFIAAFMAVAP